MTSVSYPRNKRKQAIASRLSMDLKVMPRSHKGHIFILCIIDGVTNYLITVPIYQAKSEEIGEALIENVITKYCIPEYIIMDEVRAFMSSLMTYLLTKFNIKIKTVHTVKQYFTIQASSFIALAYEGTSSFLHYK